MEQQELLRNISNHVGPIKTIVEGPKEASAMTVQQQQPNFQGTEKAMRSFQVKELSSPTKNLILGSSIFARVEQASLPRDIDMHAYSRSTTRERTEIVKQYQNCSLNTITIHDATALMQSVRR